ncbi:MAG: hypothetical protein GPJ54_16425 [Candidatus Heimdallarchaeota archaeon]|nr:hypothetical protein [Candidatus Heimdallarchaeota archaeon]
MSDNIVKSSIFLIVEFNWPSDTTPKLYKAAGDLHKTLFFDHDKICHDD